MRTQWGQSHIIGYLSYRQLETISQIPYRKKARIDSRKTIHHGEHSWSHDLVKGNNGSLIRQSGADGPKNLLDEVIIFS